MWFRSGLVYHILNLCCDSGIIMNLRPYQQEAIENIPESGRFLIHLATGLGKTFLASQIPRRGKLLWLSHREELVEEPKNYFTCSVGVEQAKQKSNGEEVVSASVQTIVKRLDKFKPEEFDVIIQDECHHSASNTYLKILDYFKPRLLIGLTATPNRSDGKGLDKVFQSIIFSRDLRWGIENGFLSNLECMKVNIGYDISKLTQKLDDFSPSELDKAVNDNKINQAIAEAYFKHARGQTIIFACSIDHAINISNVISGSRYVSGLSKDRTDSIQDFRDKKFSCLINCQLLTEGVNIPEIETIIMARPTKSIVFYTQAIGRSLRLSPGKSKALLIDCAGNVGKHNILTAPSLLGLSIEDVPEAKKVEVIGDLFDLERKIVNFSDCVESWIKNTEIVNLWSKRNSYNLHNINFFKMPNGSLVVKLPKGNSIKLSTVDKLGQIDGMPAQEVFDKVFTVLNERFKEYEPIWNLLIIKRYGKFSASEKQKQLIARLRPEIKTEYLSKKDGMMILNRILQ